MFFSINYTLTDDLIRIKDGVISGQISITIGDNCFPSLYWNDFVMRVIGMWIDSSISIINGSSVEEYPFMDGSYYFIVRILPENKVNLKFYDDYKETDLEINLDKRSFFREILVAGKNVVSFFERNKIDIENLDANKRKIAKLKTLINSDLS